jgi:DNA-binding LacI/PurR family transcriptional regulator/signal transduction histidine kinase
MNKNRSSERKTIGYITSDLSTTYNCTIWQGLKETCEKRDVNFLYFSGGQLKAPDRDQYTRNKVYDFITDNIVDGLIINATSIFHYVSKVEVKSFYKRFKGIPIVNIAMKAGKIPTVLVDNTTGIRNGLIHLINDHGYKKIAFIKGPEFNIESEIRYKTYKQVLAEYGISQDSRLVETGNFVFDQAKTCFEKLIKQNTHIDAVVAANDAMALGVLAKAQEMGIIVPNELAIMGFDDIEDARCASIPLTTVRQPIFKQIGNAVDMLLNLIEKNQSAEDVILPTELVIRKSCGCFSESVLNARIPINEKNKDLTINNFKKDAVNSILLTKTNSPPPNSHNKNPMKELYSSFIKYMEADNTTNALLTLDAVINRETANEHIDIDGWQDAASELIKTVSPYVQNDISNLTKAESFWQQLRILIQKMASHSQSYLRMHNELKYATLRNISSELISNFDLNQLVRTMSEKLPFLGVESCYMSLYENRKLESGYSRLILGYNGNRREKIPPKGIPYKTGDLLPPNLTSLNRFSNFIIEPLFFQEEHFGLIFFKTNPKNVLFEALRQQICGALKGALLVRDIVDKEVMLEKLLKDQKLRSQELENAYKVLQENQKKMLIIEKMASLGRMTAGIAHEINTPLAAIRASLVEIELLVKEYLQSIGDADVTAEDHREIAGDMNKSISISKKAAEKIVHFVQSIKSQTRDLVPYKCRLFNAISVIQDAVLLLNHELRKNKCSVNFTSSHDNMVLYGLEGRLSQIITNLLTNAIDAYKGKSGGPITIKFFYSKDGMDLTVSDKGGGIKKHVISKIFDPMFSTKSLAEGTGLGLTIVHDIITGDFGGSIEVESKIDKGTTFSLHFPKPPKEARHGKKI